MDLTSLQPRGMETGVQKHPLRGVVASLDIPSGGQTQLAGKMDRNVLMREPTQFLKVFHEPACETQSEGP